MHTETARALFNHQRHQILESLDAAHAAYYRAQVFGGPSLHFHHRALLAAKQQDMPGFAEYAYSVLTAWGMHRMGPKGSKMRDFADFQKSLASVWPLILKLQPKLPRELREADWQAMKCVFTGLRCMASRTSLVGNSKVMAHALPDLVPPVDRQYTLKFLFGRGQIKNDLELEWVLLERMLRGFFYPILQSQGFRGKASQWMRKVGVHPWDTSVLKVVDNLVIGLTKLQVHTNATASQSKRITATGPQRGLGAVSFNLRLTNTYWSKGFFNVPVNYERFVTTTDGPFDLLLGDSDQSVAGRITRSANQNATPRILGNRPLVDFFHANYKKGATVSVEILTRTAIRIGGRSTAPRSETDDD